MTDTKRINTIIATFVIIILALALTPAIAAFVEDSRYSLVTHEIPFDEPFTTNGNVTTVDYNIRNVTSTISVTLKLVSTNATVTGYTYKVTAADAITFTGLVKTTEYWGAINYQTIDLTNPAVLALITIIPILWVTIVLAVGIVAIKLQLGKRA